MRQCPDCAQELTAEHAGGVEVDVCAACAGVYFDDGEIRKLKESHPEAFQHLESAFVPTAEQIVVAKVRLCPACRWQMQPYRYLYDGPVTLDECPRCHGIWVEDGELAAMAKALDEAERQVDNPHLMRLLDHQIEVAQLEEAHRQSLDRQRLFRRVMGVLGMRRYGR